MALIFLDTSALVKLFVSETGSAEVLHLVDPTKEHTVTLLELSRVELYAAIHRRERLGDLPAGTARNATDVLSWYMRRHYLVQRLTDSLQDMACSLVDRHGLRAYDAMQLSGGLKAHADDGRDDTIFVTSDRRLCVAAEAEGLQSLDPTHTIPPT